MFDPRRLGHRVCGGPLRSRSGDDDRRSRSRRRGGRTLGDPSRQRNQWQRGRFEHGQFGHVRAAGARLVTGCLRACVLWGALAACCRKAPLWSDERDATGEREAGMRLGGLPTSAPRDLASQRFWRRSDHDGSVGHFTYVVITSAKSSFFALRVLVLMRCRFRQLSAKKRIPPQVAKIKLLQF